MLALRDELVSRPFDTPSAWWPDQPRVVGGRDKQGGGTWCASDVGAGVTAVVLNRTERRVAAPGAPSRGVLPLLAIRAAERWPEFVDLGPMASFNLVLAMPQSLTWWSYDGTTLTAHALEPGTHMFTPKGLALPLLDDRFGRGPAHLDDSLGGSTADVWTDWLPIIQGSEPSEDPLALVVRIRLDGDSFETVFGQFIATRPGRLRLDYAAKPLSAQPWTLDQWTIRDEAATRLN
jgi:Transport and Golgi organisation 2